MIMAKTAQANSYKTGGEANNNNNNNNNMLNYESMIEATDQ